MAISRISTTTPHSVVIGGPNGPDTLLVTGTGTIAPPVGGYSGVFSTTSGVTLLNHGTVGGSAGYYNDAPGMTYTTGGDGVYFGAGGTVRNEGTLSGGAGGAAASGYQPGNGGNGAFLGGGLIRNTGLVTGGDGGAFYGATIEAAGNGGAGVAMSGGLVSNSGSVVGGAGGNVAAGSYAGNGGAGVSLNAGRIINFGMISGGEGGSGGGDASVGFGGYGVSINGGVLHNLGTITGGQGVGGGGGSGGDGVHFLNQGAVVNAGNIYGGLSGAGAVGGAGVWLEGIGYTSLSNSGTIQGGDSDATQGVGGDGVVTAFYAGTIRNSGVILGGNGTSPGGVAGYGMSLNEGSVVENTGVIGGGAGGNGAGSGSAYAGATGVLDSLDFDGQSTVIDNGGVIFGGNGGSGLDAGSNGASGGSGVALRGGEIRNGSTVIGGNGGYSAGGTGGRGGAGLEGYGSFLNTAAGYVIGGSGGSSNAGPGDGSGGFGAAIYAGGIFNNGGGTLTNFGTIRGGDAAQNPGSSGQGGEGGAGVYLTPGTTARNAGLIAGGQGGLLSPATYPSGVATGSGGYGVFLNASTLANSGTIDGGIGGTIDGGNDSAGGIGIALINGATVENTGTIAGGMGGGSVPFSGNVYGSGGNGGIGVYLGGSTLTNAGTIAGGAGGIGAYSTGMAGDAVFFGAAASTLVIDPGAVFVGRVAGNPMVDDTLLLRGSGGTLSGLGTQFTGLTTIAETTGANWTLQGSNTLSAGTSLIARDDSTLTITGSLSGSGALRLDSGATISADAGLGVASLRFTGGSEKLSLGSADPVSTAIAGFSTGDTIHLGFAVSKLSFADHVLTLFDGTNQIETLTLDGHYTAADFQLHSSSGSADIVYAGGSAQPLPHGSAALAHDLFTSAL